MALKGLDIFKLSPKKNCKECGSPTCMAFSMKVAQGAVSLYACPYSIFHSLIEVPAMLRHPLMDQVLSPAENLSLNHLYPH